MNSYTRYRNLTDSELERECYGDPANADAADELRRRALDTGFLPGEDLDDIFEKADSYPDEVKEHEADVERLEKQIEEKDEEIAELNKENDKLAEQVYDAALDLV